MHGIEYYKQIELGISGTAFPISHKKETLKQTYLGEIKSLTLHTQLKNPGMKIWLSG